MKSGNRLALMVGLALVASVSLGTPASAQKTGIAALSARIAEFGRAGKYAEVVVLAQRLLQDMEKAHGPVHRDVAASLNNLAQLYGDQGNDAEAEPLFRRAIAILEKTVELDSPDIASELNNLAALYQRRERYADAEPLFKRALAIRERSLPHDHPDLGQSSKRDAASERRSKDRLAMIGAERATLQKTFAAEFPDYAALSSPLPATAKEIQALLSGDEAMVLFALVDKESYVFALTRDSFDWKPLPLGAEAITQQVVAFRHGLDVDGISNANAASGRAGLFDLALANELHAALLGPVETFVKDKRGLRVVPSGALTALPFHLLVTETPAAAPRKSRVIAMPPGCSSVRRYRCCRRSQA